MEERAAAENVCVKKNKMKNTFLPMAFTFWNLVRNAVEEMEKQGNKNCIVSDYKDQIDFKELTKWNDQNIGIPLLFNFYHGLELYMKGLLEVQEIEIKANHNLKDLYQEVKSNETVYTKEIINLLKEQVFHASTYNPFLEDNNEEISKFYDFFRYPISKNMDKNYSYGKIRGKEQKTLQIYNAVRKATIDLQNAIVKWKCKGEDLEKYLIK
jgi:hypothetical protein